MTLHDVARLNRHWSRVPPLRLTVMAIGKALGVEMTPPSENKSRPISYDEAKAMARAGAGRIPGARRM